MTNSVDLDPKLELALKRKKKKMLHKEWRKKRDQRLKTDRAFAEAYFEAKSNRSQAKKLAFKKRRKQ